MTFKVRLSKVLLLEHVPSIKQPEPFSHLPLVRVCIFSSWHGTEW